MAENDSSELTERIKKLETLQRNTRIAIIILVGYSIYDVISKDSGSEIIYAHKIKAKEFELVDGVGTIFSSWRVLDEDNRIAGLVIENSKGQQIRMTADKIDFLQGRTNRVVHLTLDDQGVHYGSEQKQSKDVQ